MGRPGALSGSGLTFRQHGLARMAGLTLRKVLALALLALAAAGCGFGLSPAQRALLQRQQVILQRQRKVEQAVLECRERRLAGELSGYVASVRCSNERIRQAWAESGYPHMDLVDLQLAYRLAVAHRVDAGGLSEQDGQRQVSELTARINAEARERAAPPLETSGQRPRNYKALLRGLGVWGATPGLREPDTIRCFRSTDLITCE